MVDEEIQIKRKRFIIRVAPLIPFFLFVILFWSDVRESFLFLFRLLLFYYVGLPKPLFTLDILFSLLTVGFNLLVYFLFFSIWLLILSRQAVLPVSTWGEAVQTAIQLVFYILKAHGPAVSVNGGKVRANAQELRRNFPGVAVVDSSSALVLEQVSWAPRFLATIIDLLFKTIAWIMDTLLLRRESREPVRVCGPGLNFIRYDERIQGVGDLAQEHGPVAELSGVVDLRRQFKLSPKQSRTGSDTARSNVSAYTRDGIELTTKVWALFSIGYEPDKAPNVIHVVCDGDPSPENLRIVSLEGEPGSVEIKVEDDELDPEDREEIFAYLSSSPTLQLYAPVSKAGREPVFQANRVFSAVFGRSHSQDSKTPVLPWMDLPVKVAIECFREILSHCNFDELYRQDASGSLKINDLRKELRIRMRNCGVLSYQLVYRQKPGKQESREGEAGARGNLWVSPVRALYTSKLLRDRGIQVFAAGFSELVPTDEVYLQRLASWRAEWEHDTLSARAAADLDAVRIYNRARARAQKDLAISFREIYQNGNHSKEALALRVFEALEAIAADQETQRLLPGDTINMLRSIHDWLLPEDLGIGIRNSPAPGVQSNQDED